MAIFVLQVSTVSRKSGSTLVRHAAYRAGARLRDDRARRTQDYRQKSDVVHREILTPVAAPGWMRDREGLWNGAEAAERRRDARLAQEVYLAIPREIPEERRGQAVGEFVRETFVAKGMVADFAIHAPLGSDGREQPHAHITLTTREIRGDGFGKKCREWDHPIRIREYRSGWARHANRALERAGSLVRVDCRSLREQRRDVEKRLARAMERRDRIAAIRLAERSAALDRIPEPSLSRAISHMEKRGKRTRRGELLRSVRSRNARAAGGKRNVRVREVERELQRRELRRAMERVMDSTRKRLGLRRRKVLDNEVRRECERIPESRPRARLVRAENRELSAWLDRLPEIHRGGLEASDSAAGEKDVRIRERLDSLGGSGLAPSPNAGLTPEQIRQRLDRLTERIAPRSREREAQFHHVRDTGRER